MNFSFPGLSSPGKCQNKIQVLSRISRTRTNPVASDCKCYPHRTSSVISFCCNINSWYCDVLENLFKVDLIFLIQENIIQNVYAFHFSVFSISKVANPHSHSKTKGISGIVGYKGSKLLVLIPLDQFLLAPSSFPFFSCHILCHVLQFFLFLLLPATWGIPLPIPSFLPQGGYFLKIWVGVCGTLLETLILLQTKICDFPYPISDLTQNLIPYIRPDLNPTLFA